MTGKNSACIESVTGRAMPVQGNDIDTDRIIPARFLRCVTFEGIEAHVFEDDRLQLRSSGGQHAFDDPRFAGASILLVNENFGCGSSREHAPQALRRWGIGAIVGESFAEIFFGNCAALGLPCATVPAGDMARLMAAADETPRGEWTLDLTSSRLTAPGLAVDATIPPGPRKAFLEGTWDATGLLLADFDAVKAVAATLPYGPGQY